MLQHIITEKSLIMTLFWEDKVFIILRDFVCSILQ